MVACTGDAQQPSEILSAQTVIIPAGKVAGKRLTKNMSLHARHVDRPIGSCCDIEKRIAPLGNVGLAGGDHGQDI